MRKFELFYCGILGAWEMLIDFPVPKAMKIPEISYVPARYVLFGFPLLGLLSGLVLFLLTLFFSGLFNPVAGGIVFALLTLAVLDFKDSGRGLALLASFFSSLFQRRRNAEQSLREISPSWEMLNHPVGILFLVFLETLKGGLLLALYYYQAKLWPTALLTGSFLIQGILAATPATGLNNPLAHLLETDKRKIWYIAVGILILLMFSYSAGAVVAGGVVYGFSVLFRRIAEKMPPENPVDFITFSGTVTEWSLLMVGILFAITVK